MHKLLIIEDEPQMRALLKSGFSSRGYTVFLSEDGKAGIEQALAEPPDLIILDLLMPGMHGLEVAQFLKGHPKTAQIPIIILTASGDRDDEMKGFEIGVRDFIKKPFSFAALLFRVKREIEGEGANAAEITSSATPAPTSNENQVYVIGGLRLETASKSVLVDGEPISLSPIEYRILHLLMREEGRVINKETVIKEAWVGKAPKSDRPLDAHVNNIRRKLGSCEDYLQTRYGLGYEIKKNRP